MNIFFTKWPGFYILSQLENCLLGFEDSCKKIFHDLGLSKLAIAGRHEKISVNYVKHNLFQKSMWSQTTDLNTNHINLLNSPWHIQRVTYIGKQLNNTKFLKESYEPATKQHFWNLLIDLDSKASDSLHYCSNFVQPGPTIFCLPSPKAVMTNLTDDRERQ